MNEKYSNIFWHQGVKIFEENLLNSNAGKMKIHHLENDITKALFNLFQHCSDAVLKTFLKILQINDNPATFNYEFQVSNSNDFRNVENRIMLSIISDSTQRKFNPDYDVNMSRPDGCIYNKNHVVLIEVKTQSPLIEEQIESHIKHYLGTATQKRTIIWEDLNENFKVLLNKPSINKLDEFLIKNFCDLLELVGIAKFSGFTHNDFLMLDSLGQVSDTDYLDFKRYFNRKTIKFMDSLYSLINDKFSQKMDSKLAKINIKYPDTWSAFYFYNNESKKHVNTYPNINFNYRVNGIELSINSEVKSSVNLMIKKIKNSPKKFNEVCQSIDGFKFSLYYKIQYLPMDNFVWSLIPGYPKEIKEVQADGVLDSINFIKEKYQDFRNTVIFEMESGLKKHNSGRLFTEKEIEFSKTHNLKPNFAIRIEKRFDVDTITSLNEEINYFFAHEIMKTKDLIELIIS
ncbi:MAG: hypothetical protein JXQ65_07890 [Candidatus Marinimicrobia bacterium]|nr:hypothetical protein [Candidatus Neomarinimicrobiota bacterium]